MKRCACSGWLAVVALSAPAGAAGFLGDSPGAESMQGRGYLATIVSPADQIIGTPEGQEPWKGERVLDVLGVPGRTGGPMIGGSGWD
jgi:hypothetical protein